MTLLYVLKPFLQLISSGQTNGPIASATFGALEKMISYDLLQGDASELASVMEMLAETVTNFKFQPTEALSDGVVFLKFQQVIAAMFHCSAGAHLTDRAVWMMLETCFTMCFQMDINEQIRRAAEHTICVIIQRVMRTLQRQIDAQEASRDDAADAPPSSRPVAQDSSTPIAASRPSSPASVSSGTMLDAGRGPYGVLCVRDLIVHLVAHMDPHDIRVTDTTRTVTLTFAQVLLEARRYLRVVFFFFCSCRLL